MKIRLISVGKTEDDFIRLGTDRFARQIRAYNSLEEIRVKGAVYGKNQDIAKALRKEAVAIAKHIDPRDRVVLLDRQGEGMTSETLARFLEKWLRAPVRSLTFVIGNAEGVDASVRERADDTLALSRMTLTHELCRLLLLEQIYRGFTILTGKRYHR